MLSLFNQSVGLFFPSLEKHLTLSCLEDLATSALPCLMNDRYKPVDGDAPALRAPFRRPKVFHDVSSTSWLVSLISMLLGL